MEREMATDFWSLTMIDWVKYFSDNRDDIVFGLYHHKHHQTLDKEINMNLYIIVKKITAFLNCLLLNSRDYFFNTFHSIIYHGLIISIFYISLIDIINLNCDFFFRIYVYLYNATLRLQGIWNVHYQKITCRLFKYTHTFIYTNFLGTASKEVIFLENILWTRSTFEKKNILGI